VKRCSRCRLQLPLEAFYVRSASKDGHQAYCIPCHREAVAQHYAANPEPKRQYQQDYRTSHRQQRRDAETRRRRTPAGKERERTKRASYHAAHRRRALEIYGGRCAVPGCENDKLRLTHVGRPSGIHAGRTLCIWIAKAGRRLRTPELEILCAKHHARKVARERRRRRSPTT
jgi:hypothetical protein